MDRASLAVLVKFFFFHGAQQRFHFQSKDLDRQKAFALVALERLRRGGYVDEHYMPEALPGYSAPGESFSREEPRSTTKFSPPRQEHNFFTDFFKAANVHKPALVASLSKVDVKNPKANHKAG